MSTLRCHGWILTSFLLFVFVIVPVIHASNIEMKLNLGGEAVDGFSAEEEIIDLSNLVNVAKMRFHGDVKHGRDFPNVFRTQRFSRYEDLVLNIPVDDGIYKVSLLFAETWSGAFFVGKRVFDVYLGSEPNGVVKVLPQFDPFREGGPGGGIIKTFKAISTKGGLTIALRPIRQNPQIAGVIISGYSYSPSTLDELPTAVTSETPSEDLSELNNIGPLPPADPALIYDAALNPKYKHEGVPYQPKTVPPTTTLVTTDITTTLPVTEATTTLPVTETMTTIPVTEVTTTIPETEATTTIPVTEATTAIPVTEATTVITEMEATSTLPVTEATTTLPVTEETTTLPVTEETTTLPITEETTTLPVTEETTTLPVTEGTTTLPVTEETTTLPVTEATTDATTAAQTAVQQEQDVTTQSQSQQGATTQPQGQQSQQDTAMQPQPQQDAATQPQPQQDVATQPQPQQDAATQQQPQQDTTTQQIQHDGVMQRKHQSNFPSAPVAANRMYQYQDMETGAQAQQQKHQVYGIRGASTQYRPVNVAAVQQYTAAQQFGIQQQPQVTKMQQNPKPQQFPLPVSMRMGSEYVHPVYRRRLNSFPESDGVQQQQYIPQTMQMMPPGAATNNGVENRMYGIPTAEQVAAYAQHQQMTAMQENAKMMPMHGGYTGMMQPQGVGNMMTPQHMVNVGSSGGFGPYGANAMEQQQQQMMHPNRMSMNAPPQLYRQQYNANGNIVVQPPLQDAPAAFQPQAQHQQFQQSDGEVQQPQVMSIDVKRPNGRAQQQAAPMTVDGQLQREKTAPVVGDAPQEQLLANESQQQQLMSEHQNQPMLNEAQHQAQPQAMNVEVVYQQPTNNNGVESQQQGQQLMTEEAVQLQQPEHQPQQFLSDVQLQREQSVQETQSQAPQLQQQQHQVQEQEQEQPQQLAMELQAQQQQEVGAVSAVSIEQMNHNAEHVQQQVQEEAQQQPQQLAMKVHAQQQQSQQSQQQEVGAISAVSVEQMNHNAEQVQQKIQQEVQQRMMQLSPPQQQQPQNQMPRQQLQAQSEMNQQQYQQVQQQVPNGMAMRVETNGNEQSQRQIEELSLMNNNLGGNQQKPLNMDNKQQQMTTGQNVHALQSDNHALLDNPNEIPSGKVQLPQSGHHEGQLGMIAPLSAGIHNGNRKFEGICLHNETHCSCGEISEEMMNGNGGSENCLFVKNEQANPMICVHGPCSGKWKCGCSPDAGNLCARSVVKSILVAVPIHHHNGGGGSEDDNDVLLCKREALDDGMYVLSPVL